MKKKKVLKIVLIVFACLIVLVGFAAWYVFYGTLIGGKTKTIMNPSNPFIAVNGDTMISAHRAGGECAPEQTMAAFKNCIENPNIQVDVFEFDLHITADKVMVLLHDDSLDRTSNSAEYFGKTGNNVSEYTYEMLRNLNMGENFCDGNGDYPYRGLRGDEIPDDIRILKLEDALDYIIAHGEYMFIIEIKDKGSLGCEGVDILYQALTARDLLDQTVFGTFKSDVAEYTDKTYPEMIRIAYTKEVMDFYFACLLNKNLTKAAPKFDVLALPISKVSSKGMYLMTSRILNYAHKYNMAVQYWTVNEEKDINHLLDIQADCIMTDNPELATKLKYD